MPQFFATAPRGLERVLEHELNELGISKTKEGVAGVGFSGNWAACYKANLGLVSASRVLYPVLDFPAYEPDQVYHNILKHDWTKYISTKQTLAVDSSVRDSIIRDLRILSLKTKDAVVDQFREKFGVRPDVNTEDPDLQISVRLVKNMCTVSLDTSGGSLHYRGYRDRGAPAPLKENLAGALVKMSGWDRESPFVDPLCGSGTLCIEAALQGLRVAPGTFRRRFGFQRWNTFQADVFRTVVESVVAQQLPDLPFRIYGSDIDGRAVAASKAYAENAGVDHVALFKKQSFTEVEPPEKIGTLVTNPPYGERLGASNEMVPLYTKLGETFREKFAGWNCWVLTTEPDFIDAIGLEVLKSHRVFNGAIECRFVKFKT